MTAGSNLDTDLSVVESISSWLVLMCRHRSGLPFHEALSPELLSVARDLVSSHGGLEVGSADAFRFEAQFPLASQALRAAHRIIVAEAVSEGRDDLAGTAAAICTGEGCGRRESQNLIRTGALALASVTDSEQIFLDAATWHISQGRLIGEYEFHPVEIEDISLSDVDQKYFQLLHPQLRRAFQKARSLERRPNNLPARTTSFVGRLEDIAEAQSRLDQYRCVTIVGGAGIGKSSLAVRVALEGLENYADGIHYVDLREQDGQQDFFDVLIEGLGLRRLPRWSAEETLCHGLGDRDMLLVLDNVDHFIIQLTPKINAILKRCFGIQILSTGRSPLKASGEARMSLGPMAIPPNGLKADAIDFDAVQLYAERANQVRSDFRLHEENLGDVVEVCRRLEGNPLAIQVAAAKAAQWLPNDLLASWSEQGLLEPLDSTLAWSVGLLSLADQAMFTSLAAIEGSITLELAQVVATPGTSGSEVRKSIDRLVDCHLLGAMEPAFPGEALYRFPGRVRHVARKIAEGSSDQARVKKQLRDFLINAVRTSSRDLSGPDQDIWIRRMIRLSKDFDYVLQEAIEGGDFDTATEMFLGLGFLYTRLPAHCPIILLERYVTAFGGRKGESYIRVLLIQGIVLDARRDERAARRCTVAAYALAKRQNLPSLMATSLANLGRLYRNMGRAARARRYARKSAAILAVGGTPQAAAAALLGLATTLQEDGDLAEVPAVHEEVRKILRKLKDRYLSVYLACNEAKLAMTVGEHPTSVELFRQAARSCVKHGFDSELHSILVSLAELDFLAGDMQRTLKVASALRGACIRGEISLTGEDTRLLERLYSGAVQICQGETDMAKLWLTITPIDAFRTLYQA